MDLLTNVELENQRWALNTSTMERYQKSSQSALDNHPRTKMPHQG
jgi:hypothetical protein